MPHLAKYASTIYTAAIGANTKETFMGIIVAIVGVLGTAVGGWDKGLTLLLALMIADYATGLLGAIKTKTVDSDAMYWGGIRKIVVLGVVCIAYNLDGYMAQNIFRSAAIFFYIGREGLSVFENLGKLGMGVPPGMKDIFTQLNDKGGKKDE